MTEDDPLVEVSRDTLETLVYEGEDALDRIEETEEVAGYIAQLREAVDDARTALREANAGAPRNAGGNSSRDDKI